jgi:hypothetical protein
LTHSIVLRWTVATGALKPEPNITYA